MAQTTKVAPPDGGPAKLGKGTIITVVLLGLLAGGAIVLRSGRNEPTHIDGRTGEPAADNADSAGRIDSGRSGVQTFHGVPLPTSSAGPRTIRGDRAWGFEHSPEGAVLAAIHIPYRVGAAPGPEVFEPTIADQMVGADKQAFLANIRSEYDQARAVETDLGPNGELRSADAKAQRERSGPWAYRVDAYSSSVATVNVLLRTVPNGSDPILLNMSYVVKWVDDDWRLVAPLSGKWSSVARQVASVPADYVLIQPPLAGDR